MSVQIPLERLKPTLLELLDETFSQVHGMFLDKGTTLYETLDGVTAEEASKDATDAYRRTYDGGNKNLADWEPDPTTVTSLRLFFLGWILLDRFPDHIVEMVGDFGRIAFLFDSNRAPD